MKAKRIVVTGGLGFIGTTVTDYYSEDQAEITIIDSNVSNVIDGEEMKKRNKGTRVLAVSVAEYFRNGGTLSDFDMVLHAASYVGPAAILDYQGTIGQHIVEDTAIVVDACCEAGVPLVYFSSAEVYGKSGILVEDSDVRVPPYYNARIEYALAKLTSEAMVLNSHVRGLRSAVIRPFNVVGPLQSRAGGFVMPTFVQQALGGRPITVFETGKQKRSFLGARDLARFICEYITEDVLAHPKVFNVGNPANTITVEDLAHRIRDEVESESEIVYMDPKSVYGPLYFEAESFEKVPHIGNATALGWTPELSLDEIIAETVDYYRSNDDTRGADARAEVELMEAGSV